MRIELARTILLVNSVVDFPGARTFFIIPKPGRTYTQELPEDIRSILPHLFLINYFDSTIKDGNWELSTRSNAQLKLVKPDGSFLTVQHQAVRVSPRTDESIAFFPLDVYTNYPRVVVARLIT